MKLIDHGTESTAYPSRGPNHHRYPKYDTSEPKLTPAMHQYPKSMTLIDRDKLQVDDVVLKKTVPSPPDYVPFVDPRNLTMRIALSGSPGSTAAELSGDGEAIFQQSATETIDG